MELYQLIGIAIGIMTVAGIYFMIKRQDRYNILIIYQEQKLSQDQKRNEQLVANVCLGYSISPTICGNISFFVTWIKRG